MVAKPTKILKCYDPPFVKIDKFSQFLFLSERWWIRVIFDAEFESELIFLNFPWKMQF